MKPEKLIIVFCCHINELIWKTALRESPNESYRQAAHWVWRKREYAGKLRKLFLKKNVFFQYIRCSPLASRRFKQPVYLLYQWRIYCNIFLDILHFLRIQEKRGNVNFVLKKTLVMTNVYWKLSDSDLFIAMICVERNSFKSNLRPICEWIL